MTLGPESRDLIDDADGADMPAAHDKERVRARLALKIGVAAGVAATTTVKAASAAAGGGGTAALLMKLLGVAGGVVAISYGVYVLQGGETTHPPMSAMAAGEAPPVPRAAALPSVDRGGDRPAETTSDPTQSGPSPAPLGPVSGGTARRPAAPPVAPPAATEQAPSPPSVPSAATPEGEAALLQRAETAIAAGDGVTALGALDMHRRLHRDGKLADQREALSAIALCSVARSSTAREAAEHYLAAHPRSSQADRIRRVCGIP